MEALCYPIGRFSIKNARESGDTGSWISDISTFPQDVATLTAELPDEILEQTYRPDGWTIRQVVHHCADSHCNALIRFKLALTEDKPTILPYLQGAWAELPDSRLPVAASIHLLAGLHERWTVLLRKMKPSDFQRGYFHPEMEGNFIPLENALAQYSWHCRHHLAHIRIALGE